MKKIAITGSNGFLGSTITTSALQENYLPLSLVRNGSDTSLLSTDANIHYIDYSDDSSLESSLEGQQVLIHNAGLTRALNWKTYKKVNVDLTARFIEIFNNSSTLKHFIFISSQAAAGPSRDGKPLTESSPCNPISLYGKSKLQAEKLVQDTIQGRWTIIRPASVFGPGDKDFLQIFKMIKSHIMLFPVKKEKTFSMIYSEDLARLILSTIDNPQAYNQIFFAADENSYKQTEIIDYIEQIMTTFSNHLVIPELLLNIVAECFEFVSKISGKLTVINKERMKEFKLSDWQISSRKAQKALKFKPQFEIYEALHKTWKWYLEKGWL